MQSFSFQNLILSIQNDFILAKIKMVLKNRFYENCTKELGNLRNQWLNIENILFKGIVNNIIRNIGF